MKPNKLERFAQVFKVSLDTMSARDVQEIQITISTLERDPSISVEEMHAAFVAQRITEGYTTVDTTPESVDLVDAGTGSVVPVQTVFAQGPVRQSLRPWADLSESQRRKAMEIHAACLEVLHD